MSNNYLITGFWGEPHITVENDRGINAAIFGQGRFVLPVGNQLKLEYIGNNTVRLYDGKLIDNGAIAGIPTGEYVDLLVSEAGQGMKRNDILVFQYDKNEATLVETGTFVIIKGTETSGTPLDPSISQEDILDDNAFSDQFPLWRIPVSGAVISQPEMLFETKFAGERIFIAESTDGVHYSVNIPGLSALYNGLELTIIPKRISASTNPTLNVNGLGEKDIKIPLNTSTSNCINFSSDNFINANSPVKVVYDANYSGGCWKIIGIQKTSAIGGINGVIPISNGGTGANNAATAKNNLDILDPEDWLELYSWSYFDSEPEIVETEVTNVTLSSKTSTSITSAYSYVEYADEIIFKNGKFNLVNPERIFVDNSEVAGSIRGKYIYSHKRDSFYFVPSDASIRSNVASVTTSYILNKATELTCSSERLGFVTSESKSTYPLYGWQNNRFYEFNKQLCD